MKVNRVLPILLGLAGLPAWAGQGYWLEDRAAEPAAQLNACAKPAIPRGPQGSGFVRLAFQLLPDGRVAESKVLISSQSAAVDRAVMAALGKCVFRPPSPAADRWLSASYVTTVTAPNVKIVPNASVKPTGLPAGQNVKAPIPMLMRPVPAGQRTAAVVDFSSCAKPVWPQQSLREEQTGTVKLRFLIGTDGWVEDSQLELTSGYPLLDFAALEGIERCRFKAATVNGVRLQITPKEFSLLAHFLLHADAVVTRTELLEKVWELRFDPGSNVVDVHVARLRAKLRQGGARARIDTVRGAGFRLTAGSEEDDAQWSDHVAKYGQDCTANAAHVLHPLPAGERVARLGECRTRDSQHSAG